MKLDFKAPRKLGSPFNMFDLCACLFFSGSQLPEFIAMFLEKLTRSREYPEMKIVSHKNCPILQRHYSNDSL
jgi:hypothetical protein